jgi:hypothetical protein
VEVIQLGNATLQAGPASSSADSPFPSGQATIPLALFPIAKSYSVGTGPQLQNVSSPNAPVALPGIGASGPVTQAHTLYLRTQVPMVVSLTKNGGSAQTVNVLGLLLVEFDPNNPLVALAVQGTGQVEFLAVGNQ